MKKEILRVHDLNLQIDGAYGLSDISFCLMAGECTGVMGLANSGITLLLDVLCGNLSCMGDFWIDEEAVTRPQDFARRAYKITASNYRIGDWSAAEYIGLVDNAMFGLLRRKTLMRRIQRLILDLGLELDLSARLCDIPELDKRLLDIAKACMQDKKIIIVEDEFEGCSTWDIQQFKKVLELLPKKNITYIISSHSDNVSHILSDRYIFFKKGHIVKKSAKRNALDVRIHEYYLFDKKITSQKQRLESMTKAEQSSKTMYVIRNVTFAGCGAVDFEFYKKEVAAILVRDTRLKEEVFQLLSGRRAIRELTVLLEGKPISYNKVEDYVRNRIVSVANLGCTDELLTRMSAGENLVMPSFHKIPAPQYFMCSHMLGRVLNDQLEFGPFPSDGNLRQMEINDYIVLVLERWYIYRPKVLVLFEPFAHCDLYGVSLIQSYIKKFTAIGTTVIIIKSRDEYIEELTDRTIVLDP